MSQTQKMLIGMLACALLFLSGCGQKGDLYLPGQKDANLIQPHISQLS